MGQDEKIREAQEVLDWVTMRLGFSIKCKVTGYKHENYRVQVLKGDRLNMPIQVSEEWVKETNPKENFIPNQLEILLRNLDNYYWSTWVKVSRARNVSGGQFKGTLKIQQKIEVNKNVSWVQKYI